MAETLQPAVLPRQGARKQTAVAALTALGIVYGDIGTSTLYGLKQAVEAGGTPTPDTVMGIVSVILWSILLIVALKYAILILRADNHGEGGIMALLALLDARHAPPGSWRASLLIVGLIGAALLYGDGVITPAISDSALSKVSKSMRPGWRQWLFPLPSRSWSRCSWSRARGQNSSATSSDRSRWCGLSRSACLACSVSCGHRASWPPSVPTTPLPTSFMQDPVSRITLSDGLLIAEVDGLPSSASRRAVGIVGSGSGSSDAPSLIKRCAVRSGHQGPVLAVLAMLATKRRLRVAPRGCALPLTAAVAHNI